jgi:Na+:H+ antiporter, NhaA family
VLGDRVPATLRVFVAALAVVDDLLSMVTLAVFYPHDFTPRFAIPAAGLVAALVLLNRARVYATWPYVVVAGMLWCALHALGVHAALTGMIVAACLPTRPSPSAIPLLAQAATALSEMEHAEREAVRAGRDPTDLEGEPMWDWAVRNLAVASERFASPAERIERAVAPWSAYLVLPLFAFSATGVAIQGNFSSPDAGHVFLGVVTGLVVGKPLGVLVASGVTIAPGLAVAPAGVSARQFVGAACLCGVADTMALLMADRAFAPADADVAKLAALAGSVLAGAIGTALLALPSAQYSTKASSG